MLLESQTPLNNKEDLVILRVLCTLQLLFVLFIPSIFIAYIFLYLGETFFFGGFVMFEKDFNVVLWLAIIFDVIITILIVWIFKLYPKVDGEEKLKWKNPKATQ